MANTNDSVLRVERNGVEYFTVKATGESAVSERGLARMSGIPQKTTNRWLSDLSHEGVPKWLKPLQDMPLGLSHEITKQGKAIKAINAKFAFKFISLVARNLKKDEAFNSIEVIGEIGLESYIQGITGYLPSKYQSAPAARQEADRILDKPNPWVGR